jgi:hypothetical protein
MTGHLSNTWHLVLEAKAAGQHALGDEVLAEVRENYKSIIAAGHVANPPVAPSGKRGRTCGRSLILAFRDQRKSRSGRTCCILLR